ncbi:MAG TPA: serine hydrolase domain-containing protein [Lacibacter sp.]|nr:serine hydrolase domain-containing protein [Lacibacter sp.]HMO87568.1 serine hydrolase domain-containing protein [Lacibacter sp.]
MNRLLFFVLVILSLTTACRKPYIEAGTVLSDTVPWADSSNRHPKNAVYRALLDKYKRLGFPGISLLINDRFGTWVGSAGYADLKAKTPFGVSQVSKAASITKLMLGTTVFKIIEDSVNTKLGYGFLDDPISKWLPARVVDQLPNGRQITLGDCMKHETGLPDVIEEIPFYLAIVNEPVKAWKPEELLEFINGKKALFRPRDSASYSNTNTILVAMVVEAATKQKHSSLMRKYVFAPLGMNQTFYQPHDPLPRTTAQGYYDLYNNGTLVNVGNITTGSGNGYGGLFSTVFDLWKFTDAMYLKKTVLTQKSLDKMNTWGQDDPPNRYGYGSMLKYIARGVDAGVGHSGRDFGHSGNLFYFPSRGVSHCFLLNYGTDGDSELRKVFRQFEQELLDVTFQ